MDRQVIIDAALELVRAGRSFVFATVDSSGFPQLRWMGGGYLEEPLTVYMAAASDSRKMQQIKAHPESQLLFQSEDLSRIAALTGTSRIVTEPSVRKRVFAALPGTGDYFSGPDDPRFGVIKFVCSKVEMIGLSEGMAEDSADM